MERESTLNIGYHMFPETIIAIARKYGTEGAKLHQGILKYFSDRTNSNGQLMQCLKTFLYNHSKKFKTTVFSLTYESDEISETGYISGLVGKVNRSEVDIGFPTMIISDGLKTVVDLSYPDSFSYVTFYTKKPEYKPHIFGIFQTFSLTVWISIAFAFIAILFLSYFVFKRKYSFKRIFFHVFSVLMRQDVLVEPSSFFETAIVYSWVFGAMFLCLAFDSVILSFLSFPPVTKIKTIAELASAVVNRKFHCISADQYGYTLEEFIKSENKNLKIIAGDMLTHNLSNAKDAFLPLNIQQNIAYFVGDPTLHHRNFCFVSEDHALEFLSAIIVRKGFPYKMLVDKFVHIVMASGIYFKILNDVDFLRLLPFYTEAYDVHFKDLPPQRKLTLTDVAPAFIFLVTGYALSIFVFLVEVFLIRNKKRKCLQKREKNNLKGRLDEGNTEYHLHF